MILKTKSQILSWLQKNDYGYESKFKSQDYQLINLYNSDIDSMLDMSQINLEDVIKLKQEGHQYIVNVNTLVDISNKKITEIPFQFYHIVDSFDCSHNELISLSGCPYGVGGSFRCSDNKITSLQYCPLFINDNFICKYNELRSLNYFPETVGGMMNLSGNKELLKYKKNYINLSNQDFLKQQEFSFWNQFHLLEKYEKENQIIQESLGILNQPKHQKRDKKL